MDLSRSFLEGGICRDSGLTYSLLNKIKKIVSENSANRMQNTVSYKEENHATQPSWFPHIFLIVINLLVTLQQYDINEK